MKNRKQFNIQRITALWAFSEAVLGGILHALKIPFTGLFVGSSAVLFISLIGFHSKNYSQIIRSTIIVIIIKALISPVTPLAAYFAVFVEGLFGFLVFNFLGKKRITSVLLGLFALLFSALQKIMLTTIIFGMLFWEAIDSFVLFIISQIPFIDNSVNFSASFIIIIIYISIHIIAGIYTGWISADSYKWLNLKTELPKNLTAQNYSAEGIINFKTQQRRTFWWKRKSGILLFLFIIVMILLSIFIPHYNSVQSMDLIFMLIRSVLITVLWFIFVSPTLMRLFQKYLKNKQDEHSKDIIEITELFPYFKSVISFTWKESEHSKGIVKAVSFIKNSLLMLLITNED